MTRTEFEELQVRAASCGTTLKEFLRVEGVAYSTYNYWYKKLKAESRPLPMAPVSIRKEIPYAGGGASMPAVNISGVTLAFPNGVRAHFGQGSERALMEVLFQSMP